MITDKQILEVALQGFMLSTAYGQQTTKLMPVSDSATLLAFARSMIALGMEEAAGICDDVEEREQKTNQLRFSENCANSDQGASYCAAAIRERIPK